MIKVFLLYYLDYQHLHWSRSDCRP